MSGEERLVLKTSYDSATSFDGQVNLDAIPRIATQEELFDILYDMHSTRLGHAASEKMQRNLKPLYENISRSIFH